MVATGYPMLFENQKKNYSTENRFLIYLTAAIVSMNEQFIRHEFLTQKINILLHKYKQNNIPS